MGKRRNPAEFGQGNVHISARPELVDFGYSQGRRNFATAVVAALRRGWLNLENNPPFGGVAKIVKAKAWATSENPNGLELDYKIIDGWEMRAISDWRYVNEKARTRINKTYEEKLTGQREYAHEFNLKGGGMVGLNFQDRNKMIDEFPNVDVDYELLNITKRSQLSPWMVKSSWFFQLKGHLKKLNEKNA